MKKLNYKKNEIIFNIEYYFKLKLFLLFLFISHLFN